MVILAILAPIFLAVALLLLLQCLHKAKEAARHKVCSRYTRTYARQAQFLSGHALAQYNASWQTFYATGLMHCGDYATAKIAFETAFKLAPTPAQANVYYMHCLMSLGHRNAANEWLKVFKKNKSYQYLPKDLIDDYQHLSADITAKRTARYKATVTHALQPLPFYHKPRFIATIFMAGLGLVFPPLLTVFF